MLWDGFFSGTLKLSASSNEGRPGNKTVTSSGIRVVNVIAGVVVETVVAVVVDGLVVLVVEVVVLVVVAVEVEIVVLVDVVVVVVLVVDADVVDKETTGVVKTLFCLGFKMAGLISGVKIGSGAGVKLSPGNNGKNETSLLSGPSNIGVR